MKPGFAVFFIAFLIRFMSAGVTTLTNLNPESQTDAVQFAYAAEYIATVLRQGQLIYPDISRTFSWWGQFLAPLWLLPGPSGFYGRVGNAFLGALAIYNIYIIARHYHSHQAGVIAVIPLIFFPSIIAVQSTLLRETVVLFGITTAIRLITVPSEKLLKLVPYTIAGLFFYIAYIQRPKNQVIYIAALGIGFLVYIVESDYFSKQYIGITAGISSLIAVSFWPFIQSSIWSFIQSGIGYLAETREVRTGGRADYLIDIIPETLPELVAFSWIGAAYFLYAPFPWMIETIPDLIVSIEGLITMGFTVVALWGVRTLAHKNKPATAALIVGFFLAVVLYGVGTVNFGTGMRHRQMFTWIVFLFGGIGIAEHVQFSGFPKLIESKRTVE